MNDQSFLLKMYEYAENLKGSKLSEQDKEQILTEFNKLTGPAESRAVKAVRSVLGFGKLTEEIRKSANLDNSRRLLQDLQASAREWQSKKGK